MNVVGRPGRVAAALLAALACGTARAADERARPVRETLLPQREFGYGRVTFAHGVLAAVYFTDLRLGALPPESVHLTVLDRDGLALFDRGLDRDVPEAGAVEVMDLALAGRATLVVSLEASYGGRRPEAWLLAYDIASAEVVLGLRTEPVSCLAIAADGDGVWCLGRGDFGTRESRNDPHVLYRLSLNGELLGSALSDSEVSGPLAASGALSAPGGGVAAWLAKSGELLIAGAGGSAARCIAAPPPGKPEGWGARGVAMLSGGTLVSYLATVSRADAGARPERTLHAIDARGRVTPVAGFPAGLPFELVGADDDALVFFDGLAAKLYWFAVTTRE